MRVRTLSSVILAAVLTAAAAGQTQPLTVEWALGEQGAHVARVPTYEWLADGSALLYDMDRPQAERRFERLYPTTGRRLPLAKISKAEAELKAMAPGADLEKGLEWPEDIDREGRLAAYVFDEDIFLLDVNSGFWKQVTKTKAEEKNPGFSPDGKSLAFVRGNDLYVHDLATGGERRLTRDGSKTTLNGTLSWVYWEEVFGRKDTAYWWSPDSRSLAYLQTDETGVPVSVFVDFKPVDQRVIHQPYPKTGDKSPKVRVGIINLRGSAVTRWVRITDRPFEWVQRVKWLPDSRRLSVQTLDRPQTELGLYIADAATGAARRILTERDPAWINVHDDLWFLADGKHFLWASERDGAMSLYRYRMDGTLVNAVTGAPQVLASSGGLMFWVRKGVTGIDEKNDWVYFTALEPETSTERHLYRVHLDGSGLERLSREAGTHSVGMSQDARYYFDAYSDVAHLPTFRLHAADGKALATVREPRVAELVPFGIRYPELFIIPAPDGFPMPAQVLKPADFDPTKKYPVILHIYGGPSAPTVKNGWQQANLFDNILLNDGFLVVKVDNRSATARSKTLENVILDKSPEPETEDLLAAVRWLKRQSWVDAGRVGVWGWSGGGTMTLSLMTHSNEFKAGIAGAPVTDWRYYDSKWAEAIMRLPQANAAGYDRTSLVKRASKLHGRVMFIYGTYDDNVHPQNSEAFMEELIKAGIPFDMQVYPMRKHGFTDTPAKIHVGKVEREFWKENL